jgi:hypothetical protein
MTLQRYCILCNSRHNSIICPPEEGPTVTKYKEGDILKLTSKKEPTSVVYMTLQFGVDPSQSNAWFKGKIGSEDSAFRSKEFDAEIYIPPLPYRLGQIVVTHHVVNRPPTIFVAVEGGYRRIVNEPSEGGWFSRGEVQAYAKSQGYEILFEGIDG